MNFPQITPDTSSRTESPPPDVPTEYSGIKSLIWLYFWLLLIEGALRKWVFPQLSTPLAVVRDPVVLLIYLAALFHGIFPRNALTISLIVLGTVNGIVSLLVGESSPLLTLYGLRTNFLHLPLIFLLPAVFTSQDVERMGRWFLITCIPMAVLVLLQFRAGADSFLNAGVGTAADGTVGGQLVSSYGKIRPPGTFSFTSGLALYIPHVAAFLVYWQMRSGTRESKLAFVALVSTALMAGISGSRTILSAVVLILGTAIIVCFVQPRFSGRGIRTLLLIGGACVLLFYFAPSFRLGVSVHESRIAGGGGVRDGLVMRALGGFLEPFMNLGSTPLLGRGLGLGTTAAGEIMFGQRRFIFAESEWLRIVGESGPFLGLVFLALRVGIVIQLFRRSLQALHEENPLPLLLFSAVFPATLSGQLGTPSTLGFVALGSALCFAASVQPGVVAQLAPFRISPESVTNPNRRHRGRSIYAEKLHGR